MEGSYAPKNNKSDERNNRQTKQKKKTKAAQQQSSTSSEEWNAKSTLAKWIIILNFKHVCMYLCFEPVTCAYPVYTWIDVWATEYVLVSTLNRIKIFAKYVSSSYSFFHILSLSCSSGASCFTYCLHVFYCILRLHCRYGSPTICIPHIGNNEQMNERKNEGEWISLCFNV